MSMDFGGKVLRLCCIMQIRFFIERKKMNLNLNLNLDVNVNLSQPINSG